MIRVEKAGPLTTLQDLGRPGFAHLGVTGSGAVDVPALRRANRLVGNPDGAAALEMTLMGARLRFEVAARVAITGAWMPASLDGVEVPHDRDIAVAAGQVLAIGASRRGVRAMLAVAGGIAADTVLDSRSTDRLSGLGPPPLREGDVLRLGPVTAADAPPEPGRPILDEPVVRFVPGPRDDWFVADALATLVAAPYRVSPDSDRIGVRLAGAALRRAIDGELPSEGLVPGAIQVPAGGQPLVFLADHPVTGGYPVIGVVVPDDLPHLAQARPGSFVRFERQISRRAPWDGP